MDCADACRKDFQMFTFGIRGGWKCDGSGKCECWCEFNTQDFKCKTQTGHSGFNLYAFKGIIYSNRYMYMNKKLPQEVVGLPNDPSLA